MGGPFLKEPVSGLVVPVRVTIESSARALIREYTAALLLPDFSTACSALRTQRRLLKGSDQNKPKHQTKLGR